MNLTVIGFYIDMSLGHTLFLDYVLIFLKNYALIHASKIMQWFDEHQVEVKPLLWFPQSPNLYNKFLSAGK